MHQHGWADSDGSLVSVVRCKCTVELIASQDKGLAVKGFVFTFNYLPLSFCPKPLLSQVPIWGLGY